MKKIIYTFLVIVGSLSAAPVLTMIDNRASDVVFKIVQPYDQSGCSVMLNDEQRLVLARQLYKNPILLLSSTADVARVTLQPVGYQDPRDQTVYYFADLTTLSLNETGLQNAYEAFCARYKKNAYRSAQEWLTHWVGGVIELTQHPSELVGHIINSSALYAKNNDFISEARAYDSQGVFSRLNVIVTIEQKEKPGILPYVKVVPGQGGICQLGKIVII